MRRFKVHYSASVWETVIVEAENKKKGSITF